MPTVGSASEPNEQSRPVRAPTSSVLAPQPKRTVFERSSHANKQHTQTAKHLPAPASAVPAGPTHTHTQTPTQTLSVAPHLPNHLGYVHVGSLRVGVAKSGPYELAEVEVCAHGPLWCERVLGVVGHLDGPIVRRRPLFKSLAPKTRAGAGAAAATRTTFPAVTTHLQ